MSLITETNQQYYQGAQVFFSAAVPPTPNNQTFTTTFNTGLIFTPGAYDSSDVKYALNNFKLYTSSTGLPGSFTEYTTAYTAVSYTHLTLPTTTPV